jgi:hypothetical protein
MILRTYRTEGPRDIRQLVSAKLIARQSKQLTLEELDREDVNDEFSFNSGSL